MVPLMRWFVIALLFCSCERDAVPANQSAERPVSFQITYQFLVTGVRHLRVQALLPTDIPNRQKIVRLDYSLTPRMEGTLLGDSIGHFRYFKPNDTVSIVIRGEAILYLDSAYRAYSPVDIDLLKSIQRNVANTFTYQLQRKDLNLDKALAAGVGDCSEYAAYAVRLCKENGFESRELAGIHSRKGMEAFHSWAECRKGNLPWVAIDPTWADEVDSEIDSLERKGMQALRNLEPTNWKLQLGRSPRLDAGYRLVSWRIDKGAAKFSATAWMN